uniref:NADH dehydrogenase subunit 6 n=1 Tax=Appolonius crassus TaxID=2813428 RepID=A0A8T9ZWV0_9HEMI|nr:NADH dehydrogenase subunit 6 [Appolonius crassus]
MSMLMTMNMMLSFLFIFIQHPLSMSIIIIIQTIIIAMMTGMMLGSFWFSYIIMIIMSSGMLVLFIYMASIASNEKFNMSIKMMIMMVLSMPLMLFINKFEENIYWLNNNYMNLNLNKLFSSTSMFITLMLVIYLLYTMITVSKIVNINNGPLRINK